MRTLVLNKYARHDGHGIYCRFELFLIQDGPKYAIDNANAICACSCAISLGPTWDITDVTPTLDFKEHSELSHPVLGRTPPKLERVTCQCATARLLSPEHLTFKLPCQLRARGNARRDYPMPYRLMIIRQNARSVDYGHRPPLTEDNDTSDVHDVHYLKINITMF